MSSPEVTNAEVARRIAELTVAVGRLDEKFDELREKISATSVWEARHIGVHSLVDAKIAELSGDIKELKKDQGDAAKERVAAARFRWTVGVAFLGTIIAAVISLIGVTHG